MNDWHHEHITLHIRWFKKTDTPNILCLLKIVLLCQISSTVLTLSTKFSDKSVFLVPHLFQPLKASCHLNLQHSKTLNFTVFPFNNILWIPKSLTCQNSKTPWTQQNVCKWGTLNRVMKGVKVATLAVCYDFADWQRKCKCLWKE